MKFLKKSITILDATLRLISLSQKRTKFICIRKCVYILKKINYTSRSNGELMCLFAGNEKERT